MYFLDYFTKWIEKIDKNYKFAFIESVVIFLLIHMYGLTDKFGNNDDMLISEGGAGLSSGRWFKNFVCSFSSLWEIPWTTGILCAIYIGIAVAVVVAIFKLKNRISISLLAICMITFPVITATMAYMMTVDSYIFSLMLVCIGVYLILNYGYGWLFGGIFFAFSLGIYQAYYCVAFPLIVLYMILYMIREQSVVNIVKKILQSIVGIILGLVIYKLVLDFLLKLYKIQLTSYMGINSMWDISILDIFERIQNGINILYYCYYKSGIISSDYTWIWGVFLILEIIALIFAIIKNDIYKNPVKMLCILVSGFLFFLSILSINVMSEEVHMLMLYCYSVPVIAAIIILDRIQFEAAIRNVKNVMTAIYSAMLFICLLIYSYECIMSTNQAYFKMDSIYEREYAFILKLVSRIESLDGYSSELPTMFVGNISETTLPYTPVQYDDIRYIYDMSELLLEENMKKFAKNYLGITFLKPTEEISDKIIENTQFEEMPCYPNDNSIQIIDGIIVVKFST